ncbi:hypothetical protein OZX57_00265 [Bifidobacterium sp. ESL0682]|uniref:hypothetical protein n=1 Tax=Bifidobacterium sp. ESL0682 TaxID=2983212 RepID=UPI0023F81407|nr:hypothetical protein [Bifidobacterium sp. ESL0682]WEV42013.1 hypothetical protein OZX57_00265 [Bifidobacterium sp. ESL0682]
MKPQLGDIIISRYTLVSPLRSVPGLEAWKANDRILARDCQLFIVTDKSVIPTFEAIASTLTLSRNPHFTPIIQIQHVGDLPVLITHLDQGLSLNNYLGHGTHKLGYEAMRSIIAETADGLETLLHDDLKVSALNTDIIRITSKGVQIADAPIEAMFADTLHMPHMDPEMLAVHELAALLYAMITGKWTSEIKGFDLSALPDDVPEEFRIICERGLKVQNMDGQSTLSMVSLSELVALLGDWKPLAKLPTSEVKRPTSDGEASILRLPLRASRHGNLLDFPQNLSANQLQFRARQAAGAGKPTKAGKAKKANATQQSANKAASAAKGAEAAAATSASKAASAAAASGSNSKSAMSATAKSSTSQTNHGAKSGSGKRGNGTNADAAKANANKNAKGNKNTESSSVNAASNGKAKATPNTPSTPKTGANTGSSANASSTANTVDSTAANAAESTSAKPNPAKQSGSASSSDRQEKSPNKWWHQRNRTRNEEQQSKAASETNEDGIFPHLDLHDLTAAEMADAFKSLDSTADDSIFPDFDPSAPQNTNPTMQFDFALKANGGMSSAEGPMNRTEATGRIPLLDTNGNLIEPGHESAQALEAEQEAIEAASSTVTPPSFTPQKSNQAAAQSINPTDEDIADTPLFGKFKTKVVAIVAVIVVIIAAAGVAAYALVSHNENKPGASTSQHSSSDPWPDIDVNKVPFGSQGNGAEAENGNGESDQKADANKQGDSSAKSGEKSEAAPKVSNDDKIAQAVPAPSIPVNNTPLTIDKQEFYRSPAGQNGLAYYMHVSEPSTVTRFVVQIRTSGGTGYLIANTAQDPNAGQQVAQFTFDASGTTDVKLQKPVKSQDFLLWVPMDSLPNHSLYINHVQLY